MGWKKNQYTFTGKPYDPAVDMYYFGARWYDAEVGRFVSKDTHQANVFDPVNIHRYVYVGNNPIIFIDPLGYVRVEYRLPWWLELSVGILWEPSDWAFTARDWLQGDFSWWDIAGFLPILSHGMVRGAKYVDDIIDTAKRAENIPEHIRRMEKYEFFRDVSGNKRRYYRELKEGVNTDYRIVVEVDSQGNYIRHWQEVYDKQGNIISVHPKGPQDLGHIPREERKINDESDKP